MADGINQPADILHGCRPNKLTSCIDEVKKNPIQKQWVVEMGWEFVFELKEELVVDSKLTGFLVANFDLEKNSIFGTKIDSAAFKDCYSMPTGTKKFERPAKATHKDTAYASESVYKDLIDKTWYNLSNKLARPELNKENFCTYFATAVLNMFVAPSNHLARIDTSFLKDIDNPENIKHLNLCAFAAEFLVDGIRHYKSSSKKFVPGCVHILQLKHVDRIFKDRSDGPLYGHPWKYFITKTHIEYAAANIDLQVSDSLESSNAESTGSSPLRLCQSAENAENTKFDTLLNKLQGLMSGAQEAATGSSAPATSSAGNSGFLPLATGAVASSDAASYEQKCPASSPPSDLAGPGCDPESEAGISIVDEDCFFAAPQLDKGLKHLVPPRYMDHKNKSISKSCSYRSSTLNIKASKTVDAVYTMHVVEGVCNNDVKVAIEGASVTTAEFISALAPPPKAKGKVSNNCMDMSMNFMDVCIRTMRSHWEKREQFNNLIIYAESVYCEDELARRLKNAKLQCLERIYIVLRYESSWALVVMDLVYKLTIACYTSSDICSPAEEIVLKLKKLLLEVKQHHESPATICFSITEETKYNMCYVGLDKNITSWNWYLHLTDDPIPQRKGFLSSNGERSDRI